MKNVRSMKNRSHFDDPNLTLQIFHKAKQADPVDPCNPSPCGPYSQCRNINGQGVCSCLQDYIGSPPSCRPECVTHSDCPRNLACSQMKCKDPCPGLCGVNAECFIINHQPVCQCIVSYTGDPYSQCNSVPSKIKTIRATCLEYSFIISIILP